LRATNVNDPDNDSTESAVATVTVPAVAKPADKKKPFPWWILAVVGGVLVLVIGVIIAVVVMSGSKGRTAVPKVTAWTIRRRRRIAEGRVRRRAGHQRAVQGPAAGPGLQAGSGRGDQGRSQEDRGQADRGDRRDGHGARPSPRSFMSPPRPCWKIEVSRSRRVSSARPPARSPTRS
jgi:hypothetical protein